HTRWLSRLQVHPLRRTPDTPCGLALAELHTQAIRQSLDPVALHVKLLGSVRHRDPLIRKHQITQALPYRGGLGPTDLDIYIVVKLTHLPQVKLQVDGPCGRSAAVLGVHGHLPRLLAL